MEIRLLKSHEDLAAAKALVDQVRPIMPLHGCVADESAATWLGAFDCGALCGCLRQCGRVEGQFELGHGHRLPRFLAEDPQAVEISQVVVRPGADESAVLTALLLFSIDYGRTQGHSYHFTTGTYPRPGKLYVDVLGMQIHGTSLESEQMIDGAPRYLYYLNLCR